MLRAFYLAFMAESRERQIGAHEPGPVMTVPVVVLGALAAAGGLIQPGPWHFLSDYTTSVFREPGALVEPAAVMLTVVAVVMLGLGVAYRRFGGPRIEEKVPALLTRAFFWDDIYRVLVVTPLWAAGAALYRAVELPIVIGIADAGAALATTAGRQVRRLQSGYLRSYALLFAGAALLAVVLVGLELR